MKVTINVPKEFEVTNAEVFAVQQMFEADLKITAIKFIRQQYAHKGLGLYEAKMLCEAISKLST